MSWGCSVSSILEGAEVEATVWEGAEVEVMAWSGASWAIEY